MYARILGPLAITSGSVDLTPRAPKQRQLLSLLLLHAGQVVTVDECVDELWEAGPPRSAHSTLQTYIMQIRKILAGVRAEGGDGPAAPLGLETRDRGYCLTVGPDALDLHRFERLTEQAAVARAAGEHGAEASLLQRALGLWSGRALADVQCGPLLRTQLSGLHEVWLGAVEQRIDADLRTGRHHRLIPELRVLTHQYPRHENLHAQLMIALYRSGRPSEALQVYARLRTVFAEELGLDPSEQLRDLQRRLLGAGPVAESVYLPAPGAVREQLPLAG
ncbi:AfsR/SARP family transcriptional regulator [Streptomyces xanthophaeus]|uniref:AfsR/SARP family transcriptional regulator n=1 Tax=Streptomyces xanthophaeus TaxID=67385 RepID=UPI0026481296|nr:AfsR/SARP family transcriptional regulator [Streptomyces xanthophaeus]WKD32293.1 AfsR/SARP family transcriptional regulator [Streptomyces xanthophaeus]